MSRRRRYPGSVIAAMILCFMATALPLFSQQSNNYVEAQKAFAAKQYAEAAKLFQAADAENPIQDDALLMASKALVNIDRFPEADHTLRDYLKQHAQSAPARYLLGYVLQRLNRPKESLEIFTQAAAISPPLANDLKIIALDYVLLNDYPDAIHWLKRAVEADPQNAEAWYDLGRAQMNQGNFIAAEQSFDRTISIQPDNAKALNNLGLSYEAQNRVPDALRVYERAIAAQQGTAHRSEQPFLNYGTLLISQNRIPEAITTLEQAVRFGPRDAKCHEALSRAYLQAAQLQEAQQHMEMAVSLDPQNSRLHFQLGRLYRRLGLSEKADAELKLSAKLYGTQSTLQNK